MSPFQKTHISSQKRAAHFRQSAPLKRLKVRNIMSDIERTEEIARLNDLLRTQGIGGRIVMTQGIHGLNQDIRAEFVKLIRDQTEFEQGNDPYCERDFGAVSIGSMTVYWKIDYYDHTFSYLSEDPSDANITKRVMTIMLDQEY